MIQQKITNDKSRVEGRLIEIYKNECNKGYNGFSDQYIKLMNEYCKNDMNEVCVQKFHNTYPNVVPTSKDVFVKECISRKQENLPTFDEGIK